MFVTFLGGLPILDRTFLQLRVVALRRAPRGWVRAGGQFLISQGRERKRESDFEKFFFSGRDIDD